MNGAIRLIPRRGERYASVLIAAGILAVWEALARAGLVSTLFFPAPSTILASIGALLRSGDLPVQVAATLGRLALGFALGSVPALALGLAMGWSRRLNAALDPLVASAHPVPKIAIFPLVMILFGIGETSRVVLIALAAFFPVLINTASSVRQISPIHFEVAANYGASRFKTFTRVLFPGSLPMILTGLRLGINIALLITIALEMVLPNRGLGTMVWRAWETMRPEQIYASLVVIAVLGVGFNLTLRLLERRLVPWQSGREA